MVSHEQDYAPQGQTETVAVPRASSTRRVQVDGLRAIAMFGVLYVHLWNDNPLTQNLRVALFFVVSGFLITHILLEAKQSSGRINVLNFYARRALRLMPALAVFVLLSAILDIDGFRSSALWHIAQLSNIYFAITQSVHPWVAGHLWSLNVLEQFYIACPLVILLLPIQRIYILAIAVWVGSVFVRANAGSLGIDGWWTFFVLPFDAIAAGIITSLAVRHEPIAAVLTSPAALIVAVIVIFSPRLMWDGFGASESYRLLCEPALCAIVAGAFRGYSGVVGQLLGSRLAQFLSRISYGVYIYHLMIWWMIVQVFPDLFDHGPRTFAIVSVVTVGFATASWYLIERPIARLKSRFPTQPAPSAARRTAFLIPSG